MTKWLWTVTAILVSAAPAMGGALKSIDVCDLIQHPSHYQGKVVRVRGSNGPACPSGEQLWIDSVNGTGIFIGPYDSRPGVSMIVRGTFHWAAGTDDPYTVQAETIDLVDVRKPPSR